MVWKTWYPKLKKCLPFAFLLSIIAGLLIDVDHLFDYIIAYGPSFYYSRFMTGRMFLTSGKAILLFHGYEYALILLIAARIVKNKKLKFFLAVVTASYFFHLVTDIVLFGVPVQEYSILYRYLTDFHIWYSKGLADFIIARIQFRCFYVPFLCR